MGEPLVSVVMPTRGRPALAVRAARSVLAETRYDLELVAVVDGTDPATTGALAAIADDRLRLELVETRRGPGAARNAGVRAARARLVGFVDDDDEWLPGKLAAQVPLAQRHALVAGGVVARDGHGRDRIWPRRLPDAAEPLSEYLFARRGLFWGETLVHTSTLLVDRALVERVPFREDLDAHEDLDWLLRVDAEAGVEPVFAAPGEPLAVWHVDEARSRAGRDVTWEASLAWIRSVRELVTPRAYAAFVLAWIAPAAARARRPRALPLLVREAFRHGRPAPVHLAVALGAWLVPTAVRRRFA